MATPRVILTACLLLLPMAPSASGTGADEFPTTFCPACWTFLNSSKDTCDDGSCLACGRIGVAVDAGEWTWTLCPSHDSWHRWPCPAAGPRSERIVRTATAMVVSTGDERLRTEAYCPECRSFPAAMKVEHGRCPTCRGPLVAVDTVEPVWFWCARGLYWRSEPCPEHRSKQCCAAHRGTLLAEVRRISP